MDMKLLIAIALIAAVSAMPQFNERQAKQLGNNAQRKLQQKVQQFADENGVVVDVNAKVQEAQAAVEALIEQYKQIHQAEIQQGQQKANQFKQQTPRSIINQSYRQAKALCAKAPANFVAFCNQAADFAKQQGLQQCQTARNCNQQVGSLIQQHRGQAEQQANNLIRQGQAEQQA